MFIEPIAHFHSPLTSKFGIPRQSGLANGVKGEIVFVPHYRHEEAVRGLEHFDYLWLIWEFSANMNHETFNYDGFNGKLTVRPPRLGGNERVGVFASRSPFRPNGLGLSCVHINKIEMHDSLGPVIHVDGADLMDGTPIYDVKPYVVYADSHPEARSGFVDERGWTMLKVEFPEALAARISPEELEGLRQVLALDPRPQYHHDPERIYALSWKCRDVRFKVDGEVLTVVGID